MPGWSLAVGRSDVPRIAARTREPGSDNLVLASFLQLGESDQACSSSSEVRADIYDLVRRANTFVQCEEAHGCATCNEAQAVWLSLSPDSPDGVASSVCSPVQRLRTRAGHRRVYIRCAPGTPCPAYKR